MITDGQPRTSDAQESRPSSGRKKADCIVIPAAVTPLTLGRFTAAFGNGQWFVEGVWRNREVKKWRAKK
jgi:hypothetical protein